MLKRKYFYIYKFFPIPECFVIEGVKEMRFKTKLELKKDFLYFFKKILDSLRKPTKLATISYYSTRSLSSFDYHIQEKGAIVDQEGNLHTTAKSYKDYLKANDLVIKDWSEGSNRKQMQLSDRREIAKLVNKYI